MEIKVYRKIPAFEKWGSLIMGLILFGAAGYYLGHHLSLFLAGIFILMGILMASKFFTKKEYNEEIVSDVDKYEVFGDKGTLAVMPNGVTLVPKKELDENTEKVRKLRRSGKIKDYSKELDK